MSTLLISKSEADYVDIKLEPIIFQDDMARVTDNIDDTQEGNARME